MGPPLEMDAVGWALVGLTVLAAWAVILLAYRDYRRYRRRR